MIAPLKAFFPEDKPIQNAGSPIAATAKKDPVHSVGSSTLPQPFAEKYLLKHSSDIENPNDPVRRFFDVFQKTNEGGEFFRKLSKITSGYFNGLSIDERQNFIHEIVNSFDEKEYAELRSILSDKSLDLVERLLKENKPEAAEDLMERYQILGLPTDEFRADEIYASLAEHGFSEDEAA